MTRIFLAIGILGCLQTWCGPARADGLDVAMAKACGPLGAELAPVVRAEARRHLVHPVLVASIIWNESRCVPEARGRAGEAGLMQLLGVARNGRSVRALLAPALNVATGVRWLALMETWCGSVARGLGAYNTGKCDTASGRRYARKIMRWRDRL